MLVSSRDLCYLRPVPRKQIGDTCKWGHVLTEKDIRPANGWLQCKECMKRRYRERYHSNPEFRRRKRANEAAIRAADPNRRKRRSRTLAAENERRKERRKTDAEYAARQRELANAWQKRNRDRVAAYRRRSWAKASPALRIRVAINWRVIQSLRGNGKGGKSLVEALGYTIPELRAHLERQFQKGMSWANHGEWHIDHIRPVASFSFSSVDDPEFRECWAMSNLRPLWARDNLSKHAKRTHLI